MLKYIVLGFALILSAGTLQAKLPQAYAGSTGKRTAAKLTEVEKVDRLIQFIRTMKGATFIRNGSEHSCGEAADHLQAKWEKHKSKIGSAKEFIEVLATKSGLSGELYMIKFSNGTKQTTNSVLTQELKRLENL